MKVVPYVFFAATSLQWLETPRVAVRQRGKIFRRLQILKTSSAEEFRMKLTPGKRKGLEAVSDARGVIAAAAMDQRGSLRSAIAKDKGIDKKDVTQKMMEEFKEAVTRVLTPHATAILLDPEYGLTAAKERSKNAGLLLAYENSGYDNTQPGRLPDLLDHYSVRRLVADGADCIKILLYYTPFDSGEINDVKHAWVERIGAECQASDVPFFLEFVGYQEGADEKGLEFAKKKPEVVTRSMEEFSKPQYAVDVLKVEVPVTMAFVQGTRSCKGEFAYTRDQAKDYFRKAAAAAKKPFIYLSAGVSNDTFTETLDLASETGVNFSGVLCGRATWKDGMPIYAKQGAKALEDWLNDQGVKNIKNVNGRLTAAKPWFSFYGVTSVTALA
jgi:tagatose 1,6-diphosphate aldolase